MRMAYAGNLTCGDCGLTFIARWGSVGGADEYRCASDHVLFVSSETKEILTVDGSARAPGAGTGATLLDFKGLCPLCDTEVATGLMPLCPVCGGRDHDISQHGVIA